MEAAEQVDDVVHPLVQVRPVAGAGIIGVGRLEAGDQRCQLGVGEVVQDSGYGSSRWAPSARIRPGNESTISESVIASRASRSSGRWTGAAARPTAPVQPRAAAPAAQPPAEILGGDVRGVERLADLRLQPRLLVQADLEVGQQRSSARVFGSVSPRSAS